jgi:hypothetical protein
MVKNWADHCDSDEEDHTEPEVEEVIHSTHYVSVEGDVEIDASHAPSEKVQSSRVRDYEYPAEPPFQAFLGNLAFSITQDQDLIQSVTSLVSSLLNTEISVVSARIVKHRTDPQSHSSSNPHRGFAYLEVASLEDLKTLLRLNERDDAFLGGRLIQLDTAVQKNRKSNGDRRSSEPGVDGTKFRGGRYAAGGNSSGKESTPELAEPVQRRSLNLKPRTKPIEENRMAGEFNSSASNIFGQARPRDEASWRERQQSEKQPAAPPAERNPGPQRGRGGGGRGRGEGGGERDNNSGRGQGNGEYIKRNKGSNSKKVGPKTSKPDSTAADSKAKPAPPTANKTTVEAEKKPVAKPPANAFAALALGDSDSD